MFKGIIIATLLTLGFAQESRNDTPDPENENITKLDLSRKGLRSLNDYNFTKYLQLEELDLSNNNLTTIKEEKFLNNTKLRSINLSGNKHLVFPKYSTIFSSSIANLNISNCGIKKLPQNAFDGLLYLKTLDLRNNPLGAKRFPTTPFGTLHFLEKVILPVENKELLKELCLKPNISIEIVNNNKHIPSAQCADYSNYEPDEDVKSEESENDKSTEVDTRVISNLSSNPDKPPAEEPHEEGSTNVQENAHQNKQEEGKASDDPSATKVSLPLSLSHKPKLEPRNDGISTDNQTLPESLAGNATLKTKIHENASSSEIVNDKESSQVIISSVTNENKSEAINGSIPMNVTTALNANNINTNIKTNQTNITVPNQPQEVIVNSSNAQHTNQSEKMQVAPIEDVKVGESTVTSNTGSTILIVLVVLVVVAGLAAFGYKFYKNRTTESRSDALDRELKEIVLNSKANRSEPAKDFVEKEPLMNNHATKENGDAKANQSSSKDGSIEHTLNAHVGSVNTFNSAGPYKPTTFKPDDAREEK